MFVQAFICLYDTVKCEFCVLSSRVDGPKHVHVHVIICCLKRALYLKKMCL